MLFNTASILVGGLAALMALPEVAAGGLGLRLGLLGNWDCDLLGFRKPEIPSCTGAGFFYFKIDGKPCCVSPHTRVPPYVSNVALDKSVLFLSFLTLS
jgi:hypothetical protein